MRVLNFDNGYLIAEVHGMSGQVKIFVLNGAWEGVLDWDSRTLWPLAYPKNRRKITEWRPAVVGEDEYY